MINAKYLGLTANKLTKIASELDAEKEALCTRIDELCEENEKLRELCRSIYINYAKDCMLNYEY